MQRIMAAFVGAVAALAASGAARAAMPQSAVAGAPLTASPAIYQPEDQPGALLRNVDDDDHGRDHHRRVCTWHHHHRVCRDR